MISQIKRKSVALLILALYAGFQILILILSHKPWDIGTQLRLLDPETKLQVKDYVGTLFWGFGILNLILILGLALTTHWWVGPAKTISRKLRKKISDSTDPTNPWGETSSSTEPNTSTTPPPQPPAPRITPFLKKCLWISTLLSMLVSGLVAWPRMNHSLWGDEDFNLRFHVHGYFYRNYNAPGFQHDGKITFRELGWRDAIFGYRTTNNHFLYTIVTKATLTAWQWKNDYLIKDKDGNLLLGHQFSEPILRIWAFIAGILSIGAWIWCVAKLGLPRTALLLAFILPFHPWYTRYLTEARGYAFTFLFLPLLIIALLSALRSGRWIHWISFGLLQMLLLYSWPGMTLQVIALNLFSFTILASRFLKKKFSKKQNTQLKQEITESTDNSVNNPNNQSDPSPIIPPLTHASTSLTRWLIVSILGALLLLQLVSPGYPQVQKFLDEDIIDLPVWYENRETNNQPWIKHGASLLALGMDWEDHYQDGKTNFKYIVVDRLKKTLQRSWIREYIHLFYLLAGVGILWFAYRAQYGGLLLATFLSPVIILYYFVGYIEGKYLFHWYFVYSVPILFTFALAGLLWVARSIGGLLHSKKGASYATLIISILFIANFLWLAFPKLAIMHKYSLNPLRESVEKTRENIDYRNPNNPENYTVMTAHAHLGAFCYDPHTYPVEKPYSLDQKKPGLTHLMRLSDKGKVPLYINLGYPEDAELTRPELFKLLSDPELYEPVARLWGLDPQHSRQLYRYKGGFFGSLSKPIIQKQN